MLPSAPNHLTQTATPIPAKTKRETKTRLNSPKSTVPATISLVANATLTMGIKAVKVSNSKPGIIAMTKGTITKNIMG